MHVKYEKRIVQEYRLQTIMARAQKKHLASTHAKAVLVSATLQGSDVEEEM
jgi:hypothetical protein